MEEVQANLDIKVSVKSCYFNEIVEKRPEFKIQWKFEFWDGSKNNNNLIIIIWFKKQKEFWQVIQIQKNSENSDFS